MSSAVRVKEALAGKRAESKPWFVSWILQPRFFPNRFLASVSIGFSQARSNVKLIKKFRLKQTIKSLVILSYSTSVSSNILNFVWNGEQVRYYVLERDNEQKSP